jgi:5'-nucleotidase
MRILVTNDDGIHGPGLVVLEKIARTLSDDVWVVAPDEERSGAGHSLTLSYPLRYQKLAEGTSLGIKSIAFSQVTGIHENGETFEVASAHGAAIAAKLVKLDLGPGTFLNVNFPDCRASDVAGVEVTRQGKRDQNYLLMDERKDMRGGTYFWMGFARERGNPPAGTDLAAAFNKKISVTPLHMNLTQIDALEAVQAALG